MFMDYQNGKIYKLSSFETDKVYVGATIQLLYKRKSKHKSNYKNWLIDKHCDYITSYEIIKYGDFDIILLEEYPCDNKEQLHARERYYIEKLNCVNKNIPGRKKKEYYQDNKIEMREKSKKHYWDNRMKMIEYSRKRYQDNKIKMLEYHRKFYQKNKKIITEKNSEKFTCECGSFIRIISKRNHYKSKKHISFISIQQLLNNHSTEKEKSTATLDSL